jgi:hypothetical protein
MIDESKNQQSQSKVDEEWAVVKRTHNFKIFKEVFKNKTIIEFQIGPPPQKKTKLLARGRNGLLDLNGLEKCFQFSRISKSKFRQQVAVVSRYSSLAD